MFSCDLSTYLEPKRKFHLLLNPLDYFARLVKNRNVFWPK